MHKGQYYFDSVLLFFLYSNIHIPILAVVLLCSTSIILGLNVSPSLLLVASSGAFLLYQFDRIWIDSPEDRINQPGRVKWYKEHPFFSYSSCIIALFTGGVGVLSLSINTIQYGFILGVLGVAYMLPYGKKLQRLKGNWLAKPACIVICWAVGVVILPVVENGDSLNGEGWSFFLYRCLLIAANVLLADLPDKEGDEKNGLYTLASVLSLPGLIRLVYIFSLLTLITGLIHGIVYEWPVVFFLDMGGAVAMIVLARSALQKNKSSSHLVFGYINDCVIGWPVISIVAYLIVNTAY